MTACQKREDLCGSISRFDSLRRSAEALLEQARAQGLLLRLCGGLACWYCCPGARGLAHAAGRRYEDIDLVAYYRDRPCVLELLRDLGYQESATSATVPGLRRTIFEATTSSIHGDIFYDLLAFSHTIDLRGRLERQERTIPLADLFLQKMQAVAFTDKDAVDVQMLLLDHEIRNGDEFIDAQRIAEVCGADWGFYRTLTLNAQRVNDGVLRSAYLDSAQRKRVRAQLAELHRALEGCPKSFGWRVRSLIGERARWYETVDEQ